MTDYLRVYGPLNVMSGYAKMTRAVLSMAIHAGYTVQAVESDYRLQYDVMTDGRVMITRLPPKVEIPIPDPQWDEVDQCKAVEVPPEAPTLFVQLPHNLNQRCIHTTGPKIGWTMGEANDICDAWAGGCRGVDTLILPSHWCQAAFRKRLWWQDLRVFPIPVDDRIYTAEGDTLPMIDRAPFLFSSVFATNERKQWRLLLAAFCEEFKWDANVGLGVRPSHTREVEELASWCRSAGARVSVIRQPLSEWDMARMYRSTDCYVLPAPEGFGLPYLEAALCGTPSISLNAGGAVDFMTPDIGYLCETHLAPILGYMPGVYPPSSLFPVTDFCTLKRVLRQAYEEREDGLKVKAAAALERAKRFTPQALAPAFRTEIERAVDRYWDQKKRRVYNMCPAGKEDKPEYGLALGAWGDTFVSLGMARERREPKRPLNMIYYGQDPDIGVFLSQQRDIADVIRIQPQDRAEFEHWFLRASLTRFSHSEEWLKWFSERANVPAEDILWTQVNQAEDQPICHWHKAELPHGYRVWAHTQRMVWGDFILLHPVSTQSARRNEHWPFWEQAIRWLLEATPYTYVLTGIAAMDVPAHGRLMNLIGKTSSMMEVLALCEQSKGVIGTCNAVSLWTVIQQIPGLIVSNAVFNHKEDYYHRWIQDPVNTILYQYDTLEWFQKTAIGWLGERFCKAEGTG